jgi:hypothetical protein
MISVFPRMTLRCQAVSMPTLVQPDHASLDLATLKKPLCHFERSEKSAVFNPRGKQISRCARNDIQFIKL